MHDFITNSKLGGKKLRIKKMHISPFVP